MTIILNDTHLGVKRAAGTTPVSSVRLRKWLQGRFSQFVQNLEEDLIINGDLFDGYDVDKYDVLFCLHTLSFFAKKHTLYLVAGNHDLSKDSSKLSSFEWLAEVLKVMHPDDVVLIMEPTWIDHQFQYIIPHLVNQQELDVAIAELLDSVVPHANATGKPIKFCLFHANYDNHFAAQADHSLNVSQDQALALINAGILPVFGHEHPKRVVDLGDGDVLCTGNQWPSSVSDCIGSTGKYAHRLLPSGNYESIKTWEPEEGYAEVDWRELDVFGSNANFIRVTGEATFEEAADVVAAVSRLRQRSEAFVVTNAVKTARADDSLDLEEAATVSQKLDVVKLLCEALTEEEANRVMEVLTND